MAALRGARRHSDYYIERARTLFPPVSPQAKEKALNYLLPHILRSPSHIARDEFAADAAQKLGIDSAVMRQELKQAAFARRTDVRSQSSAAPGWSEAEKLLLRALTLPIGDPARDAARQRLTEEPALYEGLAAASLLAAFAAAEEAISNPFALAPDEASRHLLATVLMKGSQEIQLEQVENACQSLRHSRLERRQRELRRSLAEAELRNDAITVQELMAEKIALDRDLREG